MLVFKRPLAKGADTVYVEQAIPSPRAPLHTPSTAHSVAAYRGLPLPKETVRPLSLIWEKHDLQEMTGPFPFLPTSSCLGNATGDSPMSAGGV